MLLKFSLTWLILCLGWFPTLEAKSKKQSTGISAYINDISGLLENTLDYATGLLPGADKPIKKKRNKTGQKPNKKKRKKKKKPTWDSYVKTATENLNEIYDSMKNSLGLGGKAEKQEQPEDDLAEVFFGELIAAEVVEKMTLGIVDIVSSNFDSDSKK